MASYYSAEEAASRLGVSRNTLYAYVSRGLIRSEQDSIQKRTRRYHAQDVERLAKRSEIHKAPLTALEKATDWGAPILDSAITLIEDDRFYYRGKSVIELAERGIFEETITLLWESDYWRQQADQAVQNIIEESLNQVPLGQWPVDTFLSVLSRLNDRDLKAFSFDSETCVKAGNAMLHGLLRIITGCWSDLPIASTLAKHWQLDSEYQALIDAALTLVADHELNMSSFVARCTASAGGSPYAAVAAATHAFFGRRHGGNTERIYGLFNEADGHDGIFAVIASRLKRGDSTPGFGHRLYNIDPRAEYILKRLPGSRGEVRAVLDASRELLGERYPSVDLALLLLERELALPRKAGVLIFYLGRIVGWVAHIREQYQQGTPIRPRARYIGESRSHS